MELLPKGKGKGKPAGLRWTEPDTNIHIVAELRLG